MDLEILHHGGAIRVESTIFRLKDLLEADLLGLHCPRILQAVLEQGRVRLTLDDGSTHVAPLRGRDRAGESNVARRADLLICNATQVLTMDGAEGVGLRERAVVACSGGQVMGVYQEGDPEVDPHPGAVTYDARGGVVTPGLIDPHTHPVFAGQRFEEFGLKAAGKTYLEIHKAGGGILSTVRATRAATFSQLAAVCAENLSRLLRWGVTTCEAKSGYALTVAGELGLLQVLQFVGDSHPVDVEATLLGAHTLPPEFSSDREGYVDLVIEEMIPAAAQEGLARYCDAYCEDGAFTTAEVERIFTAAQDAGLELRLHAEQFTHQGGAELAAQMNAASADHLEAVSPSGVDALGDGRTVAVLLPGAALNCRCPYPPARDLLDAGARVALGTDLNPGSSMTSALPLMMSLACTQMQVSCEEAWRAVTASAADSLGRPEIGRIRAGSQADLAIFNAPDYRVIPYHYGDNHLQAVIKRGQVVYRSRML